MNKHKVLDSVEKEVGIVDYFNIKGLPIKGNSVSLCVFPVEFRPDNTMILFKEIYMRQDKEYKENMTLMEYLQNTNKIRLPFAVLTYDDQREYGEIVFVKQLVFIYKTTIDLNDYFRPFIGFIVPTQLDDVIIKGDIYDIYLPMETGINAFCSTFGKLKSYDLCKNESAFMCLFPSPKDYERGVFYIDSIIRGMV